MLTSLFHEHNLSSGDADTAGLDNLLLSELGEELGLDDSGVLEDTRTEDLEDTSLDAVNDGELTVSAGSSGITGLLGDKGEELVNVDGGAEVLLVGLVVVTHTELTEVTGVISVDKGTVVVLAAGHTATTRVGTVLANTTVTSGNVTAFLTVSLLCSGL
jgi:hypothetical protein